MCVSQSTADGLSDGDGIGRTNHTHYLGAAYIRRRTGPLPYVNSFDLFFKKSSAHGPSAKLRVYRSEAAPVSPLILRPAPTPQHTMPRLLVAMAPALMVPPSA